MRSGVGLVRLSVRQLVRFEGLLRLSLSYWYPLVVKHGWRNPPLSSMIFPFEISKYLSSSGVYHCHVWLPEAIPSYSNAPWHEKTTKPASIPRRSTFAVCRYENVNTNNCFTPLWGHPVEVLSNTWCDVCAVGGQRHPRNWNWHCQLRRLNCERSVCQRQVVHDMIKKSEAFAGGVATWLVKGTVRCNK